MQKWTNSAVVLLRSARLSVLVLDNCRKHVGVCASETRLQGRRSNLQMLSIRRRGSFGCVAENYALSAELKAKRCLSLSKDSRACRKSRKMERFSKQLSKQMGLHARASMGRVAGVGEIGQRTDDVICQK